METILVVGGGGYIGSHMCKLLRQSGYHPVTLDNFSTGYREAVRFGELVQGDVQDRALLDGLFSRYRIAGVMHFAAFIQVGESVTQPGRYYRNNVNGALTLLEAMRDHGVKHLIFSSTAAVYGAPREVPIGEHHPLEPINPYGWTKRMVEQMLADFSAAHGMTGIALRYFNAAGADPEGELGECHLPESHLIPLVLQVASGRRSEVTVFGRDYPTPDGTCIRDYVHILDLCQAHLLALRKLQEGHPGGAFNLGNGRGYSVEEVLQAARRVTGQAIPVREGERRAGDAPILVADARLAEQTLQWRPRWPQLETMVEQAWAWERKCLKAGGPWLS
ncbi:MAG: UDP-glucose 4-epimerase GalE [Magnetococcales bacterium]|nr:UDP-glucose 4-epimerase GalE [Magnetococcales bacterium]